MASGIAANPVFLRLTHGSKWPSLRLTLGLALGLGLVVLVLVVYLLNEEIAIAAQPRAAMIQLGAEPGKVTSRILRHLITELSNLIWMVLVVAPMLVAVITASFTARYVRTPQYNWLRVTPLSRLAIVQGLVCAALYHLRILLVVTLVLIPVVLVRAYQTYDLLDCYTFTPPDRLEQALAAYWETGAHDAFDSLKSCAEPSDIRFLLRALLVLPQALTLWEVILLGVVLGTALALWHRRLSWVLTVIVVLMMLVVLLILAFTYPMNGSSIAFSTCMSFCDHWIAWPPAIIPIVVWLLAPLVVAVGVTYLAQRWV